MLRSDGRKEEGDWEEGGVARHGGNIALMVEEVDDEEDDNVEADDVGEG